MYIHKKDLFLSFASSLSLGLGVRFSFGLWIGFGLGFTDDKFWDLGFDLFDDGRSSGLGFGSGSLGGSFGFLPRSFLAFGIGFTLDELDFFFGFGFSLSRAFL